MQQWGCTYTYERNTLKDRSGPTNWLQVTSTFSLSKVAIIIAPTRLQRLRRLSAHAHKKNVLASGDSSWQAEATALNFQNMGLISRVVQVDPLVSLMKVEKVPDSTYDMIGGLDQQIKEIKEVRSPLFASPSHSPTHPITEARNSSTSACSCTDIAFN